MAYSGSASDRLTAVQSAIASVLEAQEYGVGSRRVQRARLEELRQLERDLQEEVAIESAGSIFTVGRIDRPT